MESYNDYRMQTFEVIQRRPPGPRREDEMALFIDRDVARYVEVRLVEVFVLEK